MDIPGFGAAAVNAVPVFLPAFYVRLRTFTYTTDGQLRETFDPAHDITS
ncbi:hypothetical protein AB1484_27575 [Parafrankia sp. FMc6]